MKKFIYTVLQKVDTLFEDDISTRDRSMSFKIATTVLLAGSICCVIYVFYYLTGI